MLTVRLLKVFSKAYVMMTSPFSAFTSSFRLLVIKVISLLNRAVSCSRQISTASGDFFYSSVLLITAGTCTSRLSIIEIVSEVLLLKAYWG